VQNGCPYVKDAFHEYVVQGRTDAVNPKGTGTKFSPYFVLAIYAGGSETIRLRLSARTEAPAEPFNGFDEILNRRKQESDEFYDSKIPATILKDGREVARQGYAVCYGASSFTTTWCGSGYPEIQHSHRLTLIASKGETANGRTYLIATSSQCPTNGSIHASLLGISRSI
jgi:hypothetical protein